jgi:zinc transport system substrate-binding protein
VTRGAQLIAPLTARRKDGLERLKRASALTVLALGFAGILGACAPASATAPGAPDDRIMVWVSIDPQRYFVRRIGGERVRVEVMVPAGFSPATYEPKPSQIEGLSTADMYIRIGVPFEGAWMSRILAANGEMLVVDQSEGIERIDGQDPHVWLSPGLAKSQARTICTGLVEIDRSHESFYRANLEAFLTDLDELDASIEQTLSGLENRKFMVFHPAWSYFARDYDLEMMPIQMEGSDPSAAEMAELIQTARANGIKIIFAQPEFSTQSARTIAREIGGEVLLISPLAPDWMDNLRRVAGSFSTALRNQE